MVAAALPWRADSQEADYFSQDEYESEGLAPSDSMEGGSDSEGSGGSDGEGSAGGGRAGGGSSGVPVAATARPAAPAARGARDS